MKRALLLLLALASFPLWAGHVMLTWQPPETPHTNILSYRVWLATNGLPYFTVVVTTNLGSMAELTPGPWRIGWQTLYTDGSTSQVDSIGFVMPPPAPPKDTNAWEKILNDNDTVIFRRKHE